MDHSSGMRREPDEPNVGPSGIRTPVDTATTGNGSVAANGLHAPGTTRGNVANLLHTQLNDARSRRGSGDDEIEVLAIPASDVEALGLRDVAADVGADVLGDSGVGIAGTDEFE